MERKKLDVWLPLLFSLTMAAGILLGYSLRDAMPGGPRAAGGSAVLREVMELVRNRYVDTVDEQVLGEEAIESMLDILDPHSVFIPAEELDAVNEDLAGEFQGIGIEFNIFDDTVHVINVLPGGPSEKAGLRPGDRFLQVGDSVVAGRSIDGEGIRRLLRGPSESEVGVTLLRDGTRVEATITRGHIPLYALDAAYLLSPSTGYIRINKFSESTYEEFMESLESLQKQGMRDLVLDLRDNGGGLLEEAIEMADEFLAGDRRIVYTEGAHVQRKDYDCRRNGLFEKGRLVLLMNEGSASASEVLAGALQDWDRATIVGRRSFGKGLVQEQYPLSDGSALRLTVARYYTPLGRSIQKAYDMDEEEYDKEVAYRYENGEDTLPAEADTAGQEAFVTPSGKRLFGGGGISPDIRMPLQRDPVDTVLARIIERGSIGRFAYRYQTTTRKELAVYRNPSDFNRGFQVGDPLLEHFLDFASRDTVDVKRLLPGSRDRLKQLIKAQIARQIWRTEGWYEVMNTRDPFIEKAMETLR
ncbi:MAG: S41 family peptidase [Chitinophagia bacterium]|nr:S41 family peptidase [Chitinophagia bacterium]